MHFNRGGINAILCSKQKKLGQAFGYELSLFSVALLYKSFDLDISCVTQNFEKQNKKMLFQSFNNLFCILLIENYLVCHSTFWLICWPGHLLSDSKVNGSTIALKLFFLRFVSIVKHCVHSFGKVWTFWETHKIWKIFLMVLTNQLMYLVTEEDLIKLCVLRKKSELYDVTKQSKN